MTERFPSRSIFSVVSSPESDAKLPKAKNGSQPKQTSRRRRRPPQAEAGKGPKGTSPVLPLDRGNRGEAPQPKSRQQTPKPASSKTRKGTAGGLTSIFDSPSAIATPPMGKSRQQSPPPRSDNRTDAVRRLKNPEVPPLGKTTPASGKQPGQRVVKRAKRRQTPPLVYATRLLILGVGMAVLCGTALSVFNSFGRASQAAQQQTATTEGSATSTDGTTPTPSPAIFTLPLTQEIAGLQTELEKLAAQSSTMTPGVFIADLDTGSYAALNSDTPFAAASTIKVPVLVAFFQAIDEGRVRLDQRLKMLPEHIVGGSGEMQYQRPGKEFTALEVATKMIVVSDNTATNMLIELLGGPETLNQQFQLWGLQQTAIHNQLPDIEGTNTTSPKDLATLMAQVNQGSLVSIKSRDRIFNIMQKTANDSLLPRGLGEGAIIAHKTGYINSLLADSGMVDMPSGKRYLISVLVKFPGKNERSAERLIRNISKTTYQYLDEGGATSVESQPSTTQTQESGGRSQETRR